jgi:hypothetical protein
MGYRAIIVTQCGVFEDLFGGSLGQLVAQRRVGIDERTAGQMQTHNFH